MNDRKRDKPQPLNVEVGKREADAIFSRRDRAEAHRRFFENLPEPPGKHLADLLDRLIAEGII